MEPIIGIDLGTTNSEVAYGFEGRMEVICEGDDGIVPSCVGLIEDGRVIVGREAWHQAVAAPDRTVLSVKRRMGTEEKIRLGAESFSPQEISAFILKDLKERAGRRLNRPVSKAVITVPAYFTDAQRQATREAGEIAGLEVVRIINEPTAAALAYECSDPETRHILVYDLGGGTFDVSIVRIENGVVEVLSSTGDNLLGGDDFDRRIVKRLLDHIESKHQLKLTEDPVALARLKRSAEAAKKELSFAPFALVEEDHIGRKNGQPVHLSFELSRHEFEAMIENDLSRTMESVNKALKDAAMLPSAIQKIILVGGSTRIPKIAQMLEEKFGIQPHGEIDPDLCVSIGAGIQAAREMGLDRSAVLVDITPYTFGTSALGSVDGKPSLTQFVPLIRRNTKIPARRSEVFLTVYEDQEAVDVRIYQGEAPDAEDNVLLGNYLFNLTPSPAGSEITLHFDLDLNGILKIRAVEKHTGKQIDAVIENAISRFTADELSRTRNRVRELWDHGRQKLELDAESQPAEASFQEVIPDDFLDIIHRSEVKLAVAAEDDRDEIINRMEDLRDALKENRMEDARRFRDELDDILFYLED
jgi:molecular chaperone DnaK (HSP70)